MPSWKDLNIGRKLGMGFGLVLALTATLAGTSLYQVSRLNKDSSDLGNNWLSGITAISKVATETSSVRRYEISCLLAADAPSRDTDLQLMKSFEDSTAQDTKAYEATIDDADERAIFKQWSTDWQKYLQTNAQVVQLARGNNLKEAAALSLGTGAEEYKNFSTGLDQGMAFNNKGGADATAQAGSTYTSAMYWTIGLSLAAVAVGFIVAMTLARAIASSTTQMLTAIEQIAANNLAIADMNVTSADEIGKAGTALNQMKNNLHGVIESIAGTAQQVAAASEEFSATSQQITANSEETTAQANTVSAATEQVSRNLQTVATGAEQMNATIKDIARNAGEAAKVSSNAVKTAQATNAIVSKLGDSSIEIGAVIKVITSIAQQTNLLALNATIEAARAGEAGKGFAVVANEVKELAKQTAKATEDISQKINLIQEDTKGAVDAIASISEVIDQINSIASTIATAVEEQSATTSEMSRNVLEAARGSEAITQNVAGMAQAAQSTSSSAHDSQKAASQLAETSTQLRRLVELFQIGDKGGSRSDRMAA